MDRWFMGTINKIGEANTTYNIYWQNIYRWNLANISMWSRVHSQQTPSLTPISDDIHDFEAIYWYHLLIVYQNDENSLANPTHYIKGLQNHCKTVQFRANIFWNCWRNYYLPTLTSCTNWTKSDINLSKNILVIIK